MKKERDISNLLIGLLSFVLGSFLICGTEQLITTFNYLLVCIFALIGGLEIISFLLYKDYQKEYYNKLLIAITFIWLALVLYQYYMLIINILPILFSLYLFIMGVILIIRYSLLKRKNNKKNKIYIIMSILAYITGILLIFEPKFSVFIYLKITGIYTILLSGIFIYDYINNYKEIEKIRND